MTRDDARKAAADASLYRLTDADLDLLAKSLAANAQLSVRLPKDLHWSEEIAPVLRLQDKGARGLSDGNGGDDA